ncbi:hypothetical protein ACFW1A_01040 [Kitasatospora sp. NPDC058965]|uniref:hypothetical protein n=1 Tax=Kitasatospora sp. NPDC058965 TaxID=3346682 RepID=UPI0036B5E385
MVYPLGAAEPVRRIDLGSDQTLEDQGLAWSADDGLLFAVTHGPGSGTPMLHVVQDPTRTSGRPGLGGR